jgi:hypothetical protein
MVNMYKVPEKAIITAQDLERFHASETYTQFVDFIMTLNAACRNVSLKADMAVSPVIFCVTFMN